MKISRNSIPLTSGAGAPGNLSLQPLALRHLDLLKRVDSPLVHGVEIILHGSDQALCHMTKLREQYEYFEPPDVRPSLLILTTSETALRVLELMEPESLCALAREYIHIPENSTPLWQLLALHIGSELEGIGKIKLSKKQTP